MTFSRSFFNLRRVAGILAFALIALGVGLFSRREPWRPLPGGGEVRLEQVAYVETLTTSDPGFELDDLRDWLGPKFSRLLGPYPSSGSMGFGRPTFVIAFTSRGRGGSSALDNARCEIDLPSGQVLQGHFGGGHGDREKMVEPAVFEIAPFSERRLRMRLEVEGKTQLVGPCEPPCYSID